MTKTKCTCSNPKHHEPWKINTNGIKNSLKNVIEKKDISKLTKDAYNFTMNISGFIAHYNQGGFMAEYNNVADLVRDLQNSSDIKRPDYWLEDYFMNGDQADYYRAKAEIMRFIGDLVRGIEVRDTEEVVKYTRKVATY